MSDGRPQRATNLSSAARKAGVDKSETISRCNNSFHRHSHEHGNINFILSGLPMPIFEKGRHCKTRDAGKSAMIGCGFTADNLTQTIQFLISDPITRLADNIQNCFEMRDITSRFPEWHEKTCQ